jgi:Flp pilus assembly protein TadG
MHRKTGLVTKLREQRGNAVVEMALILPFLLLLIFGITEFGRAWMTVNILQTASREGARLAVVTAPDVAAVQARATAICDAAAVHNAIVTCTGPVNGDPENKVTVTVTADFTVVSGKVLDRMRGTFPLSAQTTMRYEGGS